MLPAANAESFVTVSLREAGRLISGRAVPTPGVILCFPIKLVVAVRIDHQRTTNRPRIIRSAGPRDLQAVPQQDQNDQHGRQMCDHCSGRSDPRQLLQFRRQ